MNHDPYRYPSQVFILRLWQEEVCEGVTEWRGQLRHVASGQISYFREWRVLTHLLLAILAEFEPSQDES